MRRGIRFGTVAAGLLVTCVTGAVSIEGTPPPKSIVLTPVGVYRTGVFDGGGSEIAAYDPATHRVFTVNLTNQRIDVIDISNPASPFLANTIDVTGWGSQANSVAVRDGILAVAVEANAKTDRGKAVFFTADGALLSAVTVGALPDMLTFTPNGRFVLVANEGEPNSYGQAGSVDPEGSVSIIDMTGGAANLTDADVTTAGFTAFNGATLDPSIRIYGPGATVAQDLEPEYIAVSHDSRTAWVTLQENNAIGVIDLTERRVVRLIGLGFKNHNLAGNGLDASDTDNANTIQSWPVLGMYQPDGIVAFEDNGRTYLITANEGDVREWPGVAASNTEARRVSQLTVDPTLGAVPGRLNVTLFNGNTDADAAYEQLYSFGARSFSIHADTGLRIFDSGDALEQLTKAANPTFFNSSHTNNTRDNRSDDKGPEPENVTVARLFGRQYAFIVLERIGGVVVYELTNPAAPTFVQYINVRNFTATPNTAAADDLGPEGVLVISEEESPTGKPLLVIANEVSGTTRIFEIAPAK